MSPLSVTDSFSFGLGLCGIGRAIAPSTGFWYLKINHVASQTGGDQTPVEEGDRVLWWLDSDFTDLPPAELELKAPLKTRPGQRTVRVFEYADDGTKTPAQGATVNRADKPTNALGRTRVELRRGRTTLQATREGAIPSNKVRTCAGTKKQCG